MSDTPKALKRRMTKTIIKAKMATTTTTKAILTNGKL